ncbi:cytochrome P450 4V2 [Nephila pilipes]|uniref:Cytochrome P450 4V2 n=1 Tax=Nephila pilipes TaxID=299642 RepID=A0A8X6P589_NEPPI|nr:cytochrome P450 4V2 [Nephila pilipes]GFT51196.1 cytochrome P450 4V2 [Nephila pilipes]GFU39855.1 cytochrome P450 4V2 [Nephila pilipes]GFU54216.1 cytochrome P450 4V2 [Nephila pilipes]
MNVRKSSEISPSPNRRNSAFFSEECVSRSVTSGKCSVCFSIEWSQSVIIHDFGLYNCRISNSYEDIIWLLNKGVYMPSECCCMFALNPLLRIELIKQARSVDKWKPRRKLLTPCFHADILRGFLTVFNESSQELVEHLRNETKEEFTYISTPVTLTALDIIYGTMLGTSVEALKNNNAQYIIAMNKLTDIFMARIVKFWKWPNFIFDLTSGKEQKRLQKIIHDFTALPSAILGRTILGQRIHISSYIPLMPVGELTTYGDRI